MPIDKSRHFVFYENFVDDLWRPRQNESKSILFEIEANIKEKIFQLFSTHIPDKPVYQLGGLSTCENLKKTGVSDD